MPTTYAIPDGRVAMAATLYTGNGSTLSVANTVNGVNFQPDWVWIKDRTGANNHCLFDSVRGATILLNSNTTNADQTFATSLTSFNSTGFSLGNYGNVNLNSSSNYVAWQWKAGGTAVSNTAGSVTSSVSANTTAGFSVVTWTGTGSNSTIGHGLGVTPSMIILKPRNSADNWPVWCNSFAVNEYVYLNLTNAKASYSLFMNSTLPTSTVFSLGTWGNVNTASQTMVAYCFAPVSGYSAFGSYTGNGSADGPFVYLGFRPRFVMVKRTDSAGNWYIYDTSRETYNVLTQSIYPNLSNAEANDGATLDLVSNGFKWRRGGVDQNGSGGTYIYMAFAENPFKYSSAR